MKLYSLDKREIRSFRLRNKTLDLKTFFEDKNAFGLFMMSEPWHPKERINKRKEFNAHNLEIHTISKKIAKFLTQKKEWAAVRNLLTGNVILIKDKNNKPLSTESLNFILNQKTLSVRLLYWNENFYRENDVLRLINPQENTNTPANLAFLLKYLTIRQIHYLKINSDNKNNTQIGYTKLKVLTYATCFSVF